MQFTQTIAAAILAFSYGASAHMIMNNPVPYGSPNSSPLSADGSDFPCKGPNYSVTEMNTWEAGSTQSISFTGSVVHGGGSCQFSFTTDKEPTKDSAWKVIHSVIGGCPKAGVAGNLSPEDPNGRLADVFPVQIPADTPNGQLTFAWTWFNKVGNREMYMNCAPVTITGGADSADALAALPSMYVANVGDTSCTTVEGEDTDVTVSGCTTGSGTPSVPAPAPAPSDGQQTTPTPSSAPVPVPSAPAPAPEDGVQDVPAPAPAPSTGASCTNGAIVCISATQFGVCDNGALVPQAVASGTTCSNGAILRRAVRHPHSRRHASSMVRRAASFKA